MAIEQVWLKHHTIDDKLTTERLAEDNALVRIRGGLLFNHWKELSPEHLAEFFRPSPEFTFLGWGRKISTAFIALLPIAATVGDADHINQGINLIGTNQPDIVFLDIEIGEENGFQLLDQLPSIDFQLIFTTGHSDFAIKA